MSTFTDTLSSILAKFAEWLGIKPTPDKRFDLMEQKLVTARASNADKLEALKDEIRKLERRAVQKKQEADAARGDIKRMVVREIEQLFRDLDRLRGRENIIVANLDRISTAIAKIGELRAAKESGAEEGELDDLALELQEVFTSLKDADRETRDLEKESYEGPTRSSVDVTQRVGELEGEKETSAELSESTLKRLKEIEEG